MADLEQVLAVLIDAVAQKVDEQTNLGELRARVSALEEVINKPINPHTVVQQYDDNSEIIYKRNIDG